MQQKTIIFDMDGVIFDTENVILQCWRVIAEKYKVSDIEETFYKVIGTNLDETKRILLETYGSDFPYEQFRADYRERFYGTIAREGLSIKKGVRELLSFLKINGYRVGLASSTRREVVIDELSQAGLLAFFEVVVCGDMVERSKPEPDIYLYACKELQIHPSQAYAIEDSKNGIRSAHAAGLKVIHVPDLLPPDLETEQLADMVCKDLLEVRNYLAPLS